MGYTIFVPSTGLTEKEYTSIETQFTKAMNGEISWSQFQTKLQSYWNGITQTAIETYMENFRTKAVYLP